MLERILNFIAEKSLFKKNHTLLVAVSGGIDSIVLVHLLNQASFQFDIAHCNFHLRGDESNKDESFVKELASELGVKLHVKSFETPEYAKAHSLSTQMAARNLRYKWFEELRYKHKYSYVATAHHLNDSLETALFNFTKGSGIAGMRGILPKKNQIIRPLLFATRSEIENFAQMNKIKWREDISNSSNDYQRNYIRHKVIPLLKKINPSIINTFERNADKITQSEYVLYAAVEKFKSTAFVNIHNSTLIRIEAIKSTLSNHLILFESIKEYGFTYDDCRNIVTHCERDSVPGKLFLSNTHQLLKDRDELIITSLSDEGYVNIIVETLPHTVTINTCALKFSLIEDSSFILDSTQAFIDYNKISLPLVIRTWKDGDHFQPLGMHQTKKLSNYFIDEKFTLNEKKKQLLVCSNNEIIWVVGKRINEQYKVNPSTTTTLHIELN